MLGLDGKVDRRRSEFVTASRLVKPADSDYPRSCHCFHPSAGSLFDCIVSSMFVARSLYTGIVLEEVENE